MDAGPENPAIIVRLFEVYENGNFLLLATTEKVDALRSMKPGNTLIERDWIPAPDKRRLKPGSGQPND